MSIQAMLYFALPLGVEHRAKQPPVATFILIGLNVLSFLITLALSWQGNQEAAAWFHQRSWLIPAHSPAYCFLTSQFVQPGISQLAGSMIFLFLFGACMEDRMGRVRFTAFFLLGGLLGNLAQIAVTSGHFTSANAMGGPAAGITSCLGAFLVLMPRTRIEFTWVRLELRDFSISTGSFFVPAWLIISIWVGADAVMMTLMLAGKMEDAGMMFGAQAAGFIWGMLVAVIMKSSSKRTVRLITRPESQTCAQHESRSDQAAMVYLFVNQTQIGPFTPAQVAAMLADGAISADTLYWRQGLAEWHQVRELQSL